MEQAVAIPAGRAVQEEILDGGHVQPPLVVANLVIHSAQRRALRLAQIRCAAFMFAALVAVAAYILVPLALALHVAVLSVPVVLVVSAAVLTELALMVAFIIGKWRYDLIAAGALLIAMLVGIVAPEAAFTGFSNDIVIIVGSALVVSAAVARSGIMELLIRRYAPNISSPRAQLIPPA